MTKTVPKKMPYYFTANSVTRILSSYQALRIASNPTHLLHRVVKFKTPGLPENTHGAITLTIAISMRILLADYCIFPMQSKLGAYHWCKWCIEHHKTSNIMKQVVCRISWVHTTDVSVVLTITKCITSMHFLYTE